MPRKPHETDDTPSPHYMRIAIGIGEACHTHPDCGCRLESADNGEVAYYQCALHAAAPALVEALKECVTALVDHVQYDGGGEPSLESEAWKAARAAIACAEGRAE